MTQNVGELVADYLSLGIDPQKSTTYLQSLIPEVTKLFILLDMLVSVSRLQHIPTLKDTMRDLHLKRASLACSLKSYW